MSSAHHEATLWLRCPVAIVQTLVPNDVISAILQYWDTWTL